MSSYRQTIGALIGLARTTYSDPHSPELLAVMLEVLAAGDAANENTYNSLRIRMHNLKRQYAPGCADCAAPCGRTADFDMERMDAEADDIQAEKLKLLDALHQFGLAVCGKPISDSAEQLLFDCLGVIEEAQSLAVIQNHVHQLHTLLQVKQ